MSIELTIVVPAFNEAHRLVDGMKRFDTAVDEGAVDVSGPSSWSSTTGARTRPPPPPAPSWPTSPTTG